MPPEGGWQPPQQPYQGPPYDPAAFNPQQQPPPAGWQQGSWRQQPAPPPPKGGSVKWLLVAVAVLLVIGISVGATLIFTRDGGGGGGTPSTGAQPSDVASANDTGPVTIISDESTCDAYVDVNNSIANVEANGWSAQRSALGPGQAWTPDQRMQAQAVATVIRNAADKVLPLATQTTHRVVRELYEQFIAYGRAYADSIDSYTPNDNFLADANVSFGNTLLGICNSITYKSASRSLAIGALAPPKRIRAMGSPEDSSRFLSSSNSACSSWVSTEKTFLASTEEWQRLDSSVPGSGWNAEQRATQLSALPALAALADNMEAAGRQSGNPAFEDFAALGALYFRAYVSAGDGYIGADSWLSYTGLRVNNAISGACQAAAG